MSEIAWLNGRWMRPARAKVSAEDRGFLFGDGVYEGIVSYGGRAWALQRHLRRLARSLHEVGIEGVDVAEIGRLCEQAARRSRAAGAFIYVQVTRGAAPRSHDWTPDVRPTIFLTARAAKPYPPECWTGGCRVVTLADERWGRCDVKSVNLLANVLAFHRARAAGAFEGVLVRDGAVTEGTHSGVFIVRKGVAITREDGPHVLPSITRDFALEIAADLGVPAERRRFTVQELLGADEAFLVGTASMIMPISHADGRAIAGGAPGPVTLRFMEGYKDRIARRDDAPRD
ncbi:MAG: aminotransferase class IV [Phycisphaerae bacterium]